MIINPRSLKKCFAYLRRLQNREAESIKRIREEGIVQPELITRDQTLQNIIRAHPAIRWATVRSKNPI